MRIIILLTLIVLSLNIQGSEKDEILNLMSKQQQAWNEGNLKEFMEPYLKSDKLMFVGKNGIKYGWQTTLDNYKKTYPDKAAMGILVFDVLQVEINGENAFVLGKWQLTRAKDVLSGYYTLYWKKMQGNWVITIDHTS